MIIIRTRAISVELAEAARASLDNEVGRKRAEGLLDAGTCTNQKLSWTEESLKAARAFLASMDLTALEPLIDTPHQSLAQNNVQWTGPIVYGDVSPEPLQYPSTAKGYGVIGLLALGTLQLPEVGDSGNQQIEGGSVAYYRDISPVVYRSCGGGRALLFYVSI